ncbi:MAG: hypothetical protein DRI37_02945 [Chloroflexi bacterium]|nr:MAG: hypothetical protein DRI37_02945 [Chloroflexota bacterium]
MFGMNLAVGKGESLGNELVANPAFSVNVNDVGTYNTSVSHVDSSCRIEITDTYVPATRHYLTSDKIVGKTYLQKVSIKSPKAFDLQTYNGDAYVFMSTVIGDNIYHNYEVAFEVVDTLTEDQAYFRLDDLLVGDVVYFDNVSIKQIL